MVEGCRMAHVSRTGARPFALHGLLAVCVSLSFAQSLMAYTTQTIRTGQVRVFGESANPDDQKKAIEKVAKYLRDKRLTDGAGHSIADLLLHDYPARVRFDNSIRGEGVYAETGNDKRSRNPADNRMGLKPAMVEDVLNGTYEKSDDPATKVTAGTIRWALTLVHEYVHMSQGNPQMRTEFEQPAWSWKLLQNQQLREGVISQMKLILDGPRPLSANRVRTLEALSEELNALVTDVRDDLRELAQNREGYPTLGQLDPRVNTDSNRIKQEADGWTKLAREAAHPSTGKPPVGPDALTVTVTASATSVKPGEQVSTKVHVSPDSQSLKVLWYENGALRPSKERSLTWTFDSPGLRRLRAVVQDASGAASAGEVDVTVEAPPPTPAPAIAPPAGQTIAMKCGFSSTAPASWQVTRSEASFRATRQVANRKNDGDCGNWPSKAEAVVTGVCSPGSGPRTVEEARKKLAEEDAANHGWQKFESSELKEVTIGGFRGWFLDTAERFLGGGWSSGYRECGIRSHGHAYLISAGQLLELQYEATGTGCWNNSDRTYVEAQAKVARDEARSVLMGVTPRAESGTGAGAGTAGSPGRTAPGAAGARSDAENPLSGRWSGSWTNEFGEKGADSLALTESAGGSLNGTWSGNVPVKGKRLSATTARLQGKTATRSYQIDVTLSGDAVTLQYVATRLDAPGSYTGRSNLRPAP